MDNYHITKNGDKWDLTKEGNERPSKSAETKQQIIEKQESSCLIKRGR